MTNVIFSLGSNLGDRKHLLEQACSLLKQKVGDIIQVSSIYKTPPVGFEASTDFYNICLRCHSILPATEIMQIAHQIEMDLGRTRNGIGYSSRTIDIDLIFFGEMISDDPNLKVPHPAFRERLFVLLPLNEIASEYFDPVTQKTVNQLMNECSDTLNVEIINSEQIHFE